MGRPASGSSYFEGGRWKARITMPAGHVPPRKIYEFPVWYSEEQAIAKAKEIAQAIKLRGVEAIDAVEMPADETVRDYWDRFLAWKESKGQRTVEQARGRFTKWIDPVIGHLGIRTVKPQDVERVVTVLDAALRDDEIESGTATNIWSDLAYGLKQAATAKPATRLRVRDDNPAANVQGPDREGEDKDHCVLYPSEAVALFACPLVPLARRRAYAVTIYSATRQGEARAVTAADVDVAHMKLSITKQADRNSRADVRTKTKRGRIIELEPELLPLIKVLAEEHPSGRLLQMPRTEELAAKLRRDVAIALEWAGIPRRPDLLLEESTELRLALRFHDLRHTGLVWMAVRGDPAVAIQWRGGHTDMKTTSGYLEAGGKLAGHFGTPFPPLPQALIVSPGILPASEPDTTYSTDKPGDSRGCEDNRDPRSETTKQVVSRVDEPRAETSGDVLPRVTPGSDPAQSSILADLAALVARAVEAGDLALASALIQAQRASSPPTEAPVVDLRAARARRK